MTVILADLGGTHIRLALGTAPEDSTKYRLADYPSLDSVLDDFLSRYGKTRSDLTAFYLASACAPINGIIEDKRFSDGSDHWVIDLKKFEADFGLERLVVLNDLEAACYGLIGLPDDQAKLLHRGTNQREGTAKILIGVGTGIGHAYLFETPDGKAMVQKTHGGHIPAMAVNQTMFDLIEKLKAHNPYDRDVIIEDFVSGTGIKTIYRLLNDIAPEGYIKTADILPDEKTVKMYWDMLGMYVNILMMTSYAYGGIYLYGGLMEAMEAQDKWDMDSFRRTLNPHMIPYVTESMDSPSIHYVTEPFMAIRGLDQYRKLFPA